MSSNEEKGHLMLVGGWVWVGGCACMHGCVLVCEKSSILPTSDFGPDPSRAVPHTFLRLAY